MDSGEFVWFLVEARIPALTGLPSEHYKTLTIYLTNMFSEALEKGFLLQMLNKAIIILIPKKGLEDVGRYRPISLLYMHQKILAKLFSKWT